MNGWRKNSLLKYASPTPKIILFGVGIISVAIILKLFEIVINRLYQVLGHNNNASFSSIITLLIITSLFVFLITVIEGVTRSNERRIKYMVRKRLCASYMGNPLHLIDGEVEPLINVCSTDKGFKITVECQSAKFDDVSNLETVISDCLRNKFGNYAVVSKEEDIAGRYVEYYIEDVVTSYNAKFGRTDRSARKS